MNTLLSSNQKRASGLPVIEVLGNFQQEDSLILTDMAAESGEAERWMVSMPEDGQDTHEIRFLASEQEKNPTIYLIQNGEKVKAQTSDFGQYISFMAEGSDVTFAVSAGRSQSGLMKLAAILVGGAAALGLFLHHILSRKRRSRKDHLRSSRRRKQASGGKGKAEKPSGTGYDEDEWLDDF